MLLYLAGGVVPLVLATVSTREDGADHELSARVRAKAVLSQVGWAFTRWRLLTQAL